MPCMPVCQSPATKRCSRRSGRLKILQIGSWLFCSMFTQNSPERLITGEALALRLMQISADAGSIDTEEKAVAARPWGWPSSSSVVIRVMEEAKRPIANLNWPARSIAGAAS
ncbi:hypothetical protein EMIT0P44_550016 [Pseudomonas sp. IT-P44]